MPFPLKKLCVRYTFLEKRVNIRGEKHLMRSEMNGNVIFFV